MPSIIDFGFVLTTSDAGFICNSRLLSNFQKKNDVAITNVSSVKGIHLAISVIFEVSFEGLKLRLDKCKTPLKFYRANNEIDTKALKGGSNLHLALKYMRDLYW